MNYWRWLPKKELKNATITQRQSKDTLVTIWATNLITHDVALFTTSIFSQSAQNLISAGMRQVELHQVMVRCGDGLTEQNSNKPDIMKGGQTILVSDILCGRPHAYMHIRKMHVKPPGRNVQGKIEAKEIICGRLS